MRTLDTQFDDLPSLLFGSLLSLLFGGLLSSPVPCDCLLDGGCLCILLSLPGCLCIL